MELVYYSKLFGVGSELVRGLAWAWATTQPSTDLYNFGTHPMFMARIASASDAAAPFNYSMGSHGPRPVLSALYSLRGSDAPALEDARRRVMSFR